MNDHYRWHLLLKDLHLGHLDYQGYLSWSYRQFLRHPQLLLYQQNQRCLNLHHHLRHM
jgi:hypothetical protein